VSVRRLALESAIMIVTIAMRLSPLERDLLAAGLLALHQRLWPGENPENAVQGQPSMPTQKAAKLVRFIV